MLPYFLIYPLWVAAAVVYPALMSLHAVTVKEEQEVWLGYWVLYAAGTVLYPFTDHILWAVVSAATYLIGMDLYYELQVIGVVLLVNPKMRQLDKVIEIAQTFWDKHGELISGLISEHVAKVKEVGAQMIDKAPSHKIE